MVGARFEEAPGSMGVAMKTHDCGTLRPKDAGTAVKLAGWVQRRRDHGGLIFVDLRDRSGVVQVVVNPERVGPEVFARAERLRSEYVIMVEGEVVRRMPGMENPALATGEIEVVATALEILNEAATPPFPIDRPVDVEENLRLRYRYLDLRRPDLQRNLALRHRVTQAIRSYLDKQGFYEIETPMLTRSTPEGARDYLVPSRVNPGTFYALPQSPQLFKQLLMVSGFERYFQIARCFRDEDLRADRQPEFTQLDVEMSFVDENDVLSLIEGLIAHVFREALGVELAPPFRRITYQEAVDRYGSDKPDLRYDLPLVDVSSQVAGSGFRVFSDAVAKGGVVKGINAGPGKGGWSRREIDQLGEFAQQHGAKGLAWILYGQAEPRSPIAKFLSEEELKAVGEAMGASTGDLLLFVADTRAVANDVLGRLRRLLAEKLGLIPSGTYEFCWIVDWPLLEWDDESGRYHAMHHPFTSPNPEDLELLETAPEKVRARAYDLVLNGYELGGGSIRIHQRELQTRLFRVLGIDEEAAQNKFGFLLEAFTYGAPPHGGIALGLDRLVMLMAGGESLRDVIAFPKTQRAMCLLTQAPAEVDPAQIRELRLRLDPEVAAFKQS